MKVTVAVLNKHGDSAVTTLLDLLNSFDFHQVSHFGVVTPKKSFFEKSLGIVNRQGLDTSTLLGCISSRAIVSSSYDFLQLDDAALALEGKVYTPIPKTALTEQMSKEPQHCETILQTLIEQADGDYAFWMLKRRLDSSRTRPNRRSTSLLWREQGYCSFCHQPHGTLAIGHREPNRLFRRGHWRLQIKTASNSNQ